MPSAMHSGRSQSQRERAMDGFRRGKYQVMVATDIAARGIDIDGISHVINYDVPAYAEDYIHRIGRTGRAAATGDAITFVAPDEQENFRKIEKFIGKEFEFESCEGFDWAAPDMPRPKPVEKKSLARTHPEEAAADGAAASDEDSPHDRRCARHPDLGWSLEGHPPGVRGTPSMLLAKNAKSPRPARVGRARSTRKPDEPVSIPPPGGGVVGTRRNSSPPKAEISSGA